MSSVRIHPGTVSPLFPLPDLLLFPGMVQPLHIFEPRYRQMTTDALDSSGHVVIGTVLAPHHDQLQGDRATVQPLGGVGRIDEYQRLDDGRYLLLLTGIARVRIEETESDRLYRKVRMTPVPDRPLSASFQERYRGQLAAALGAYTESRNPLPEHTPVGHLADLLLLHLGLNPHELYDAFAQTSIIDRADLALGLHAQRSTTD